MFENENFSAPNILTGTAQVESTIITQQYEFVGYELYFYPPEIGQGNLVQLYVLEGQNIVASPPDIGETSFPFNKITTPSETFTEVSAAPEIWTIVPPLTTETWTEQV